MIPRVAIVGQSFRLPGASPENWWDAIMAGRNLVTRIDPARFPPDAFQHPDPRHPGTSHTFAAGVIDGVGEFDAQFFGISPREAALIDPQQRLLLEMGWEALESAGIPPRSLRGSASAVYVGISSSDYAYRLIDDLAALDGPGATGNAASIAANRLSWFLDLRGPSMAIDTACSSSLVAFHQACQSIRTGESTVALAAGVNLLLHPYVFINFSKANMLSRQGRCRVFDASADGYVRAEGGAVLVLKELEAALADGNPVLAVVAGSGINADGHTHGLTVPNVEAQTGLLARVYAEAGVAPEALDYFEAHGTGTPVGDPIETRAISLALARHRAQPLPIGSIKSNIGHLEAASGMAGLIKALHCLRHRVVPATIGVETINPNIPVREWNLDIVTTPRPLRAEGRLLIGVNSFGFGGANAHVVLESHESRRPSLTALPVQRLPIVVTAADVNALRDNARQLAQVLDTATPSVFPEIAHTLIRHRDWLPARLMVEGGAAQIAGALRAFADGDTPRVPVAQENALSVASGGLAFIYAGNGAQWEGMGRRLLTTSAAFRDAVGEVDTLFSRLAGFSLIDELLGLPGPGRYAATEIAQPCLFALQVGVTRLLRAQGVVPDAVAGHSVGEIAAAWACGALSLEAAVEVVHHRSRLQGTTRGSGTMTAVGIGTEEVTDLMTSLGLDQTVGVAARNSATATTLAGLPESLSRIEQALAARGIFYRRLKLDYAFHSEHMDPLEAPLRSALEGLTPQAASLPFFSTVSGGRLNGEALQAEYWWHNIRHPVLFGDAVDAMLDTGINLFLEIGPHPVLSPYLKESLRVREVEGCVIPSQSRDDDDPAAVWRAGARAILAGAYTDWSAHFSRTLPVAELPAYAWQRRRLWHPTTHAAGGLLTRRKIHPLLGFEITHQPFAWENTLDTQQQPALADHRVREAVIFPAAGYLELALAAAARWQEGPWLAMSLLDIRAPLVLGHDIGRELRCELDTGDGRFSVRARPSLSSETWVLHAQAELPTLAAASITDLTVELPKRAPDFDADAHYTLATRAGLEYGPAFRRVQCGWREDDAVLALLSGPRSEDLEVCLSPTLLDAAFQLALHFGDPNVATSTSLTTAYIPVRIGRMVCRRAASPPTLARVKLVHHTDRTLCLEVMLFDAEGALVASLPEVDFRSLPRAQARRQPRWLEWRRLALDVDPGPRAALYAHLKEGAELLIRHLRRDAVWERQMAEIEPLLDTLADYHARRALEVDVPGAPEILPTALHQLRSHLQASLAEGAAVVDENLGAAIAALEGSLLADNPEWSELVLLVARSGYQLPQLLSGAISLAELQPRGLAFSGLLERCRGTVTSARMAHGLEQLLRARCADGPLDVIEVADGSPFLLPHLAEGPLSLGGRYRLASASSKVLGHARGHWPGLETEEPGVPVGRGDFGVAFVMDDAGTLHAQQALMRHAAGRLGAGGTLVMAGQWPARWVDLVLGGHEGWFSGEPPTSRQQPPDYWNHYLTSLGFEEITLVSLDHEQISGPWLLLAKATSVAARPAPVPGAESWILLADKSNPLADALAAGLSATGDSVICVEDPTLEQLRSATRIVSLNAWEGGATQDAAPQLRRQSERCAALAALVARLDDAGISHTLNVVCRNPLGDESESFDDAATWGFVRSLMNETEHVSLRLSGLEHFADPAEAAAVLVDALRREDTETEVLLRPDGLRTALRLVASSEFQCAVDTPQGTVSLETEHIGSLESLRWVSRPEIPLSEEEIEVAVEATGLNFRDLMLALGLLPPESVVGGFAGPTLGLEFAGTVTRVGRREIVFRLGDRVLGYGAPAFANLVRTQRWALAPIPRSLTFEAAATIPTAFVTAWYALQHLARLKPGESVLIHGAAGGVGLAAIQVARLLGAEVHATVSAGEKRDFLALLGIERLYDSRSLAFADEILAVTGGRGVDVVLNSLSGAAIARSLEVLRPFGRFIELGKRDFYENTRLGLRPFRNNISYFGVDVDQLMVVSPELARRLFDEVIQHFLAGDFMPLPHRVFDATQVLDAFRHMQSARHIGKIVVSYPNGVPLPHAQATKAPTLKLRGDGAYLVSGGLSGLGLEVARWLVARGARHLWLCSRTGTVDGSTETVLAELRVGGVQIHAEACDVAEPEAVESLLATLRARGYPLRGIVHAASVYDDGMARNLDASRTLGVLAPKIAGALNLDRYTRPDAPDFLVVLSSATTSFGNPGQAAYVAANHWLEAFARARQAGGLTTCCLGFGPVEDAGYLARNPRLARALAERLGGRPLRVEEALRALEVHLVAGSAPRAIVDLRWPVLSQHLRAADTPRFSSLAAIDGTALDRPTAGSGLKEQLHTLAGPELRAAVIAHLCSEIGAVLSLAADEIDPGIPAHALGLDSLMGVELAVAIESSLGVKISEMGMGEESVESLATRIIRLLGGEEAVPETITEMETDSLQFLKKHEAGTSAVDFLDPEARVLRA